MRRDPETGHADQPTVRVMTYNIRACKGIDNVRSAERIAHVIGAQHPTVACLQEVDLVRARSGLIDQAAHLAGLTGLVFVSALSFTKRSGGYGNAVLSKYPLELVRHKALPRARLSEARSAMWVRVDLGALAPGAGHLNVINTHLSFLRSDRPRQIKDLMGSHWLTGGGLDERTVLCGDLNCTPTDAHFCRLAGALRDVQGAAESRTRNGRRTAARAIATEGHMDATWPTRRPMRCLDHILVTPDLEIVSARVARTREARVASDHFPLIADLRLGACQPCHPAR